MQTAEVAGVKLMGSGEVPSGFQGLNPCGSLGASFSEAEKRDKNFALSISLMDASSLFISHT